MTGRAPVPLMVPLGREPFLSSQRFFAGVMWTLTVGCSLLAAAPAVAEWGYLFDIAASVSYFTALPLLFLVIVAVTTRHFVIAACATVAAVTIAALFVSEVEWPAASGPPAAQITVLVCNIENKTDAWHRLRAVIDERKPDLVGLVEVEPEVMEAIKHDAALAEQYPFQITTQGGFAWSRVVLSRHPFELLPPDADRERYKGMYALWRSALVSAPQGAFVFIVEHIPSPRSELAWSLGNKSLSLLGELVHTQLRAPGVPILIAGDFNTSPTGYRHRMFRKASGLRPDPLGFPPQGSWPSIAPRHFSLPLDRAWGSEQIEFTNREVLNGVGSDHRPILVTFRIRK